MIVVKPEQARADALTRFTDQGESRINCAQAVLHFALLVSGLNPDLGVAARHLGGGIARVGETCGALVGAALALGLRDQHSPGRDPERVAADAASLQDLLRHFSAEFGSRRCIELTGHDLSTPEGYRLFRESGSHERCADYVGWVCDRLVPALE